MMTFLTRLLWRPKRGPQRAVPDWLPHEPFTLRSADGARLHARWFPAAGAQTTVVLAHPDRRYAQDWFVLSGWLDVLHDAGHNVLTFDFVGYGQSRGGQNYFHEHLIAAVDEARRRAPHASLAVVGVSLGAFVAINAAVEIDDLSALVLESPYPTFAAWYESSWMGRPLRWLARTFPRTARRIDAEHNVSQVAAPEILIVASREDRVTPVGLTRRVAARAPAHAQILEFEAGEHLELFAGRREYRDRVLEMLARATPPSAPKAVPGRRQPAPLPRPRQVASPSG